MENMLQLVIPIITAVATSTIGYFLNKLRKAANKREKEEMKRLEEMKIRDEALCNGLVALCRDRILQGYRYYKNNNGVSAQDLETMDKLYAAYHKLGGNGTITAVHDKIQQLPLKEGEV